jgi:hypothetical protein
MMARYECADIPDNFMEALYHAYGSLLSATSAHTQQAFADALQQMDITTELREIDNIGNKPMQVRSAGNMFACLKNTCLVGAFLLVLCMP